MTKLQISSYRPENAAAVAHAHLELNPEHRLIAFACPGCGQPISILCRTCSEPLCAITAPDCEHTAS